LPLTLSWQEIALRLALTVLGGAALGFDRTKRGRPAGIRTTLLVCLAASVSMLQANELLNTTGKASDSFVVLDLMRFPLGILTGIGFIGGGVILRRENVISGVTTAATIWIATVLGLCFGGGQLFIGLAGLGIAIVALWLVKPLEDHIEQEHRATLVVSALFDGPQDEEICQRLLAAGYKVRASGVTFNRATDPPQRTLRWEVSWQHRPDALAAPSFVDELAQNPAVRTLQWKIYGGTLDA
jgi:putative Mg2+ transporter-C (MgtC) family protein